MTRARSLLVLTTVLTACGQADGPVTPSDAPPVAAAVTHFRERLLVTDDLVVANPCSGEDVLLHLDQLFMIKEVSVEGKFFHGHLTFLDRGTVGEGLTSGAVYRQTGAEQDFLHLKGPVGANQRVEITVNLIGKGSVPNFLLHEIIRVNVSQQGVIKLEFVKIREVCRG